MPSVKAHCEAAERTFGKPYTEVHEWLDAFYKTPGFGGIAHRRKRHHLKGIMEISEMWGERAADVARQHIKMDLEQIDWKGPFPIDEDHCIKLGLWVTR